MYFKIYLVFGIYKFRFRDICSKVYKIVKLSVCYLHDIGFW
jgi:hypothetical protein